MLVGVKGDKKIIQLVFKQYSRDSTKKKKPINAIRPSVTGLGSRNLKLKFSKSYKINRIKYTFQKF